jgi:pimeloyl-ACP methyl ester carboxylesterase
VAGLILLATGARLRVSDEILKRMAEAARSANRTRAGAASSAAGDAVGFAYHPESDPALVAEAMRDAARTPAPTAACDWAATDGFDRMSDLGAVAAPALVMTGTDDGLTPPKYARYLAERVPGAELVTLERAGHMFPVERSAEVAEAIERFLARIAR